ncbi:MAG: hypothetical protein K2Q07_00770 [Burkholderiaceae bacterium]|nr:hypothetical protein [Burkholderiaceae bacterium]
MTALSASTECLWFSPIGVAPQGAAVDDAICLDEGGRTWDRAALRAQVQAFATHLTTQGTRVLATLLDNSAAWVVAFRLATQSRGSSPRTTDWGNCLAR